ncbi:DNA polymerase III subunit gamma/tau [Prosthecochloris sp. GSB1]|uniref:DNA polymerase III subunit gamma/tau n=1 Tax=Prosthecochloris sp. GSB1 TaxID=281093 RepID=UPI000B8C9032|nr:DNA polymerase III subunit gamma/tau [Prosthecochloris sp. GSB1]ASQ90212.1 DNA polymerase III subunit gamma/tau [Prosthecochloris sp. GSB1]
MEETPASGRQQGSGSLDFSSWRDKFAKFAKSGVSRTAAPSRHETVDDAVPVRQFRGVAEVEKFRVEWKQFLDHLLKKNLKVIVTHLRVCELSSFSDGTLYIGCARRFSYEELLQDISLLAAEFEDFYGIPVKLGIFHDEEKDANTKEQTIFTIFRELSEQNEVVRFIVREFGGELVY